MASSSIETHPQKEYIDRALVAGHTCRSIAEWCDPPLHYATISRYAKKHPELAKETKAIALPPKRRDIAKPAIEPIDLQNGDAAAPIRSKLSWIWDEVERGVDETRERAVDERIIPGDVRARASLLNVARGVVETHAKLAQLPGFVAYAPQINVEKQLVVVMPSPQPLSGPDTALLEGEVIDVDEVE